MLNALRLREAACSKQHGPLIRGILIAVMVWTIGLQIYLTYRGVTADQKELLALPVILMVTGIILPLFAIAKTKKAEGPEWPHF